MDYLSGNAGKEVSVTSQRLHVKEKDFFETWVVFLNAQQTLTARRTKQQSLRLQINIPEELELSRAAAHVKNTKN